MGIAADERRQLCALFDEVGPDAPTLCGDWKTRELAAHLAVRERRADAAPGILIPAVARHLDRVQDGYAAKPWPELVGMVRSGPPWFWPTKLGALDDMMNTHEFFVHHEDVRRARDGWQPREADPRRDGVLWAVVRRMGRALFRQSPGGVRLRTPGGKEATVKGGAEPVTVVGEPGELLLFAFGRDAVARVTLEGDPDAVAALRDSPRGV